MRSVIGVVVASREVREIRKRGASIVIHLNIGTDSKPRAIHLVLQRLSMYSFSKVCGQDATRIQSKAVGNEFDSLQQITHMP